MGKLDTSEIKSKYRCTKCHLFILWRGQFNTEFKVIGTLMKNTSHFCSSGENWTRSRNLMHFSLFRLGTSNSLLITCLRIIIELESTKQYCKNVRTPVPSSNIYSNNVNEISDVRLNHLSWIISNLEEDCILIMSFW